MSAKVHPEWAIDRYYFDGQCKPGTPDSGIETFSVGIFRIERARKGLKRGPVQIRIRGYHFQLKEVCSLSREICYELNMINAETLRCKVPRDFPKLIDLAAKYKRQRA